MERPDQILTAALKLFVSNGFQGTPTSKIAEEAGVSNGTLFHYFKSKDELVVALYVHVKGKLNQAIQKEVNAAKSVKDKFKALFRSSILWSLDNKKAHYFIQQVNFSPHFEMISKEVKEEQTRINTQLIMQALSENIHNPIDPELIGAIAGNHINGTYEYLSTKKLSGIRERQVIEEMFQLVWTMIKK